MKPIPASIGRFSPRELYLLNSLRDLDRELRELRSEMQAEQRKHDRPRMAATLTSVNELLPGGFTEGQHDV